MSATKKPYRVDLRVYQVGFGDCFLLTFFYKPDEERHVLIDFGSTIRPLGYGKNLMLDVAGDIHARCTRPKNKLVAVVATHRHKDHISGFTTKPNGKGTGDLIAACKPKVVVQPWTEDLKAAVDAQAPTSLSRRNKSFVAALGDMQSVAGAVAREARRPGAPYPAALVKRLTFIGDDNKLSNRSAIENLATMAPNKYVYFGSKTGMEPHLPGVKIRVLGPPTLDMPGAEIGSMTDEDPDEFWHLQAAAGNFVTSPGARLFSGAETYSVEGLPPHTRRFVQQLRVARGSQLLELVRELDDVLNNTSVILLFQVGRKKFLYTGDAQLENWSYALSKPDVVKALEGTDVYKVGHHASLNATPKQQLWERLKKRSDKPSAPNRLRTVVSTMKNNTHGDENRGTEVPRSKLMTALREQSTLFSTQELKPASNEFFRDLTLYP